MNKELPVILLKGLVLLPFQEVKLDLNNKLSKEIISLASKSFKNELLVVCPKDQIEESPDVSDLPTVGVVGHIKSKMQLVDEDESVLRITITGKTRVYIDKYLNPFENENLLAAEVHTIDLPKLNDIEIKAAKIQLVDVLEDYLNASPYESNSILSTVKKTKDLNKLTDIITSFVSLSIEKKLNYMQEINAIKRAKNLSHDLKIK